MSEDTTVEPQFDEFHHEIGKFNDVLIGEYFISREEIQNNSKYKWLFDVCFINVQKLPKQMTICLYNRIFPLAEPKSRNKDYEIPISLAIVYDKATGTLFKKFINDWEVVGKEYFIPFLVLYEEVKRQKWEQKYQNLKDKYEELYYSPGNPGMKEAEDNFNKHCQLPH